MITDKYRLGGKYMRLILVGMLSMIYLTFSIPDAGAEIVTLKSGKQVEGDILEQTDSYIKVLSRDGSTLYYENKYVQGIEKDKPDLSESHLKKGLELASEGKFKEAREEFAKGLDKDSPEPNIQGAIAILDDLASGKISEPYALYLFKGSNYLMSGKNEEAIASLENALKIKPDDLDVCYNLGVAYYSTGHFEKAVEYLKRIVSVKADDAPSWGLIGNAYYMLGKYDLARENLIRARDLFAKWQDKEAAEEIDELLGEISKKQP